jgi:glucan phosphoethanolaminetransferase (alkaline phosphatase superfamily)
LSPTERADRQAAPSGLLDPVIDSFNYPFWAGMLVLWVVAGGLYSSRVYDFRALSFWLAFASSCLRAFVAAVLLMLCGSALQKRWGRFGESGAQAAFLLATLFAAFEAIFFLIVGMPVSEAFDYLLAPESGGMLKALKQFGLPPETLLGILFLTAASSLGIAFLAFPRRRSSWKRRPLRTGPLVWSCYLAVLLVLLEQLFGGSYKNPYAWRREQTTFPLYVALISPKGLAHYPARIVPLGRLDQEAAQSRPPLAGLKIKKDVDVILVIVESLRADYVTPEIMPNLAKLQKESVAPPRAFSNANVTFMSWQAILDSRSPVYPLAGMPDLRGSPALRLLHEAGFRNYVFAADHDMGYYDSGRAAFGRGNEIADIVTTRSTPFSPESDQLSVDRLMESVGTGRGERRPRFDALFLDCTHVGYSWPPNFPAKFKPFMPPMVEFYDKSFDLLGNGVPVLVSNRYKNSLFFVDSLIGKLVKRLRSLGVYDRTAIVVVGDHGEEFGEHNAFGHASDLYNEQTRIPLIMKLPGIKASPVSGPVSQIDILPTILDYVGLGKASAPFVGGRSLLEKNERPVLIVSLTQGNEPRHLSLNTAKFKFDFLMERVPGGVDLSVWQVSDLNDRTVVPGKGLQNDYRSFLDWEFVPQLNSTGIIAIPRPAG